MILAHADGVLVQGITGRQGTFWTERMRSCGTNVIAGTSPGKGGRVVQGVPVYDSVATAARTHQLDVSVLFTPPLATRSAALEAIHAGIRTLVLLAEHVPAHDTMEILAEARDHGARVFGPNTAGLVVPGEAAVGIMPASAPHIFRPGRVGVISRSGSLGTLVCLNVVRAGFGQSAFLGIGGDPIVGTTTREALAMLDADARTEAIVLVGEVGGTMEEEAAEYLATMTKPVVALVAGRTAPPERRMGHAGAIVSGGRGSAASKISALAAAGARVLETPSGVGPALVAMLAPAGGRSHASTAAS